MTDTAFKGFKPSVLQFLIELSANNDRDWFTKNKQRYEEEILKPSFNYISAIGHRLPNISQYFTAIPKRIGGSLMRVYRDTRFSKDKTPYKTNIGIQFRHLQAKDVHAPGYYLHIAPDEIFIGIGMWHPTSGALLKIREHIIEYPDLWIAARDNEKFCDNFKLIGDKLKSAPRGFLKDHELIEDLKWKDFIAVRNLDQTEILRENFVESSTVLFKAATPYMKFLCDAVDIPF